jgi:thymidylate kinase
LGIGGGVLVAIEGAHGSGKTTLVMAVTACLKVAGWNAIAVAEVTRTSPFVEETAIFKGRGYSISSQLQLFASQIVQENLAARHHEIVVADRSIFNSVAYGRFLLEAPEDRDVLDAMNRLAENYGRFYDCIFYLDASWLDAGVNDAFRPTDSEFWHQANDSLISVLRHSGVLLLEVPVSLSLATMTDWVVARIEPFLE